MIRIALLRPRASAPARVSLSMLWLGLAAFAAPAPLPTFDVDDTADRQDADLTDGLCRTALGTCTLRAAIQQANASAGPRGVRLPPGVYGITIPGEFEDAGRRGDLDVAGEIRIAGGGARTTYVDANGLDRVFDVHPGARATFRGLTVRNGGIDDSGGGIRNAGQVQLFDCTLSGNDAIGDGGGLWNAPAGEAEVVGTAFTGNEAFNSGGGIANAGELRVVNSTLSRNRATSSSGAAIGGGLRNLPTGSAQLVNATLAFNRAAVTGGNLLADAGGVVRARSTIFARALGGGNCEGAPRSAGHNLDDDGTCSLRGPADLTGVDPVLEPLAFNGGGTRTHALGAGSPALDAGANEGCPLTDQRGVTRPRDGDRDGTPTCDIGAYERR